MRRQPMPRPSRGFSLVELLLVLGAIALIAIVAFFVYPSVKSGLQARQEVARIRMTYINLDTAFPSGRFTGLTQTAAVQAQWLPASLNQGSRTAPQLLNLWGGGVSLTPIYTGAAYALTYDGVPSEACVRLVPELADTFQGVTVGGFELRTLDDPRRPINPVDIASGCQAAEVVRIVFQAGRSA